MKTTMSSVTPVRVLPTKLFRREFMQCIGRRPTATRVVSPFIGKLPAFQNILEFARDLLRSETSTFQVVTQPPGTGSNRLTHAQAEAIVRLGVDLLVRSSPTLHSKIYHFRFADGGQTAFVGSANFTLGGFNRNDETMAMMMHAVHNHAVSVELDRLSGRGSTPYSLWKAQGQRKRRIPNG